MWHFLELCEVCQIIELEKAVGTLKSVASWSKVWAAWNALPL